MFTLTPSSVPSGDDLPGATSGNDTRNVSDAQAVTTARTVKALAVVQPSARGRRASLLAGGDGRALQQAQVDVPPSAADLVRVNRRGEASLVLGPRIVRTAQRSTSSAARGAAVRPSPHQRTAPRRRARSRRCAKRT